MLTPQKPLISNDNSFSIEKWRFRKKKKNEQTTTSQTKKKSKSRHLTKQKKNRHSQLIHRTQHTDITVILLYLFCSLLLWCAQYFCQAPLTYVISKSISCSSQSLSLFYWLLILNRTRKNNLIKKHEAKYTRAIQTPASCVVLAQSHIFPVYHLIIFTRYDMFENWTQCNMSIDAK